MVKSRRNATIDSNKHGASRRSRLSEADRTSPLPLVLTDDEDITAICTLVQAGQAKAVMQLVLDPMGGVPLAGLVVTKITPSGWRALEALIGKGNP